jgi:hypothetical protein
MMRQTNVLLVEGDDDEDVVIHLWRTYSRQRVFEIKNKHGVERVFEETDSTLVDGNADICIGIVVDADLDLKEKWQRVTDILQRASYKTDIIPPIPDPKGTVIEQDFKPKFGVWIMPDNEIERGYLEDFLSFLVPENDVTWEQAKGCISNLQNKPFIRQNVNHTIKAEILTYLAWQKEPGKPFGAAIAEKYLKSETAQAQNFVNWLKRLFVE